MPLLLFFCALGQAASLFTLSSPDFTKTLSLKQAYQGMGCTGNNLSPALTWENPPADTKSFALTVFDPDAPTGSGWWHWVLYNIPANTRSLPSGLSTAAHNLPPGATEGLTDFGTLGYGGPCPPLKGGIHHYQFTLFALKTEHLTLRPHATAAMIGFHLHANTLQSTVLTGEYSR